MTHTSALVLFSGGQDSTICLAHALARYDRVETVGFDYGQRHSVELECRPKVISALKSSFPDWAGKLGEDHVCDVSVLGEISDTAMTSETEIEIAESGLPNTFVPGRNLLFLTLAGAIAWRRGITTLVGGMCETDYSGYPDCRRETMDAQALTLARGMDRPYSIETPLMWLDKAETWDLATSLGGQALVDLVIEETHTCYLGDRTQRHAWGYGCGTCPACELRARGYEKWQAQVAA
ncbi:MAG: 7-cyano-7-deazaguanine synthase QueC [Hyphomonadaceae bacterium]|nr:7-cyano-7-deazaguanine synthase QueC [Hyphomonadaceae bacterium]